MTDVSNARQAIRDYAREPVIVDVPVSTRSVATVPVGMRGETAGKTFEALQAVLTVCDDVRIGKRVLSPLGIINTIEWQIEQVMTR